MPSGLERRFIAANFFHNWPRFESKDLLKANFHLQLMVHATESEEQSGEGDLDFTFLLESLKFAKAVSHVFNAVKMIQMFI